MALEYKNDIYTTIEGVSSIWDPHFLFLFLKKVPTPLYLSSDKNKRQSGKYTTITPIKTLPKNKVTILLVFKLFYSLIN